MFLKEVRLLPHCVQLVKAMYDSTKGPENQSRDSTSLETPVRLPFSNDVPPLPDTWTLLDTSRKNSGVAELMFERRAMI